jgi:hypothetical protein
MINVLPGIIGHDPESDKYPSKIPMSRKGRLKNVAIPPASCCQIKRVISGQAIGMDGGIMRSV